MKTNTFQNAIALSICAFGLTLALAFASGGDTKSTENSITQTGPMGSQRQEMQEQRKKMLADMQVQDADLAAQIEKIKSAPESQKVDLIVAVLSTMVEQHAAMHDRMAEMMDSLPTGDRPMMKGMGGQPSDAKAMDQK